MQSDIVKNTTTEPQEPQEPLTQQNMDEWVCDPDEYGEMDILNYEFVFYKYDHELAIHHEVIIPHD
jgi:hypothetical protein